MLQRPLIPLLLAFAGGILAVHFPAHELNYLIFPFTLVLAALLLLYLACRPRYRPVLLLVLFFSLGAFLQLLTYSPSQLRPLAQQREKVILEGTLLEPVRFLENTAKLVVSVERLFLHTPRVLTGEKVTVTVYGQTPRLLPGRKIRFPAKLRPFRNFRNPGAFDYVSSMAEKGFVCAATVSDGRYIVPMGPGKMPFPYGLLEKIRKPIRQFIRAKLRPEEAALFQALILGERQGIDRSLREPFSKTGLGHILAVSGLHIGLVSWAAFFLIKWILMRSYRLTLSVDIRKLAALITCIPVVFYASLAGLQVSTQRAMIMALVFFASVILDREKDIWSTLAFAALIVLSLDPDALFSISFQLSFGAVLGILWLTSPLIRRMGGSILDQGKIRRAAVFLGRHFLGLAAICLAAQVFLFPMTVFYFHRVSPVALFANLMVIPLLGLWIIPAGLFSALVLPLSPDLAGLILQLGAIGLQGMMHIIEFWSQVPFASFWMVTPNFSEILLFYAVLFCIFFFIRWAWTRKALVVLCGLLVLDAAYWTYQLEFRQDLRVTFLDVGQGSSALIQFPGGKRMVIDGGGFPGSGFDVGRNVVAPFLWHSKIRSIDTILLSHPQADHMNGLVFMARAFHPKEFWYNGDVGEAASFGELIEALQSQETRFCLPQDLTGGRNIGGAEVCLLYPKKAPADISMMESPSSLNDRSMVLKVTDRQVSFLFTGDIEKQAETALVEEKKGFLKSRILLSPHHGSRTSSSKRFLQGVAPKICIISCGENNRFGFPHRTTLNKLRTLGCRILRTDREGAIQVLVSGKKDGVVVKTFRNGWRSVFQGW